MPAASLADVQTGLLASRLADISYASSPGALHEQLTHELSECMLSLLWFSRQPSEHEREQDEAASTHLPQWFLARGQLPPWLQRPGERAEGFFLVFRGTSSTSDITRDLLVRPTAHGAAQFHGGFLSGVRDDAALHEQLRDHLGASSLPLYLIGHSLGGSLALTLLAADILPPSYRGAVTCVALGSPAILYGDPPAGSLGRAEMARASAGIEPEACVSWIRAGGLEMDHFVTSLPR